MSQNRAKLLEQLEGLSTSLTAVLDRLGQIELEVTASKNEANRQISALRDFLNSPALAALAGPDPSAGADVSRANESIQKLSVGETQEQILEIFLEEVETFCDRAILFLLKDGTYVPWKSLGFELSILDAAQVEPEDPISRSARQQRIIYRTDNLAEAFPWLSSAGEIPATAICIPLIFEDTAPVVLFADSVHGIELDSLELLSHLVVLVLKNHYLLTCLEGGLVPVAVPIPRDVGAASEMTSSQDAEGRTQQAEAALPAAGFASSYFEAQEAAESESIEPAEVEDLGEIGEKIGEAAAEEPQSAETFDESGEVTHMSTRSTDWSGLLKRSPDPVEELDLSAEESPVDLEAPAYLGPSEKGTSEAPSLGSLLRSGQPLHSEELGAPVEEEPEDAGPREVPDSSQEPQFDDSEADATPVSQQKHDDARRFARLLVSEIKLYHEDLVNEGRRLDDIYGVLRSDIDRSREMYERRADPGVKSTQDHFHSELVRILGEGSEDRMGETYPGPRLHSPE